MLLWKVDRGPLHPQRNLGQTARKRRFIMANSAPQCPKKVLVLCLGNSDRSPLVAAVLQTFLNQTGQGATCESVGIDDAAKGGGSAAFASVKAAKRLGIDLSAHKKRHVSEVDLSTYDLFVVMTDEIAGKVVELRGGNRTNVFNVDVTNPWPVQFQEDFDICMPKILGAAYLVVQRYYMP
ncbi:hypothetical protein EXS57_00380 [Candidatus Kaiserbacteria bacterium]|nr:hypothetical protein [Candidatus Kaiserbacteria bacterium]